MRRTAGLLSLTLLVAAAAAPNPSLTTVANATVVASVAVSERVVLHDMAVEHPDRNAALQTARYDAVVATVPRLYLQGERTLAEDLLMRYIGNYYDKFVQGAEVTSESFAGGKHVLRVRVYVNAEMLKDDLAEKRFLYKPASRPRFVALMDEVVNNEPAATGQAQTALASSLNRMGLRRNPFDLYVAPTDDAGEQATFAELLKSAQRNGVEVVALGTAETTLKDTRKLYLRDHYFYEAKMTARLVRVDTGETIFETTQSATSAETTTDGGIRVALERAADKTAEALATPFNAWWPHVVQNQADYLVLVSGTDATADERLASQIGTLGGETRVFTCKSFGSTSLLSVIYKGPRESLVSTLETNTFPLVRVRKADAAPNVLEVQVVQ